MSPFFFSFGLLFLLWTSLSWIMGSHLVPSPLETGLCLAAMSLDGNTWIHITITVFRGVSAISITLGLALLTGIPAGLSQKTMSLITPLVAALQATPPILWITLIMIWAGTGSTVPIFVVLASLFPPLFFTIANGVASLDTRLFKMARIHGVKKGRIAKDLILRGIQPNLLAGLSFALGSCWKVTAVAEFLGSTQGIGSRIYWAYRMLEMPELFAWGCILVGMGMAIEFGLIRPMRQAAATQRGKHA
ncbi:ABC transporter permease subunit [Desulfobotulus sp. H1]|uniref:ABC transporter permease subunit n=1 Tax=Desulfobotulus pelophilus TaxID=2823377 RepID=A0ABT3NBJ8_9BACT|nr:ABC transporter permease subunit [Desulfobotulus pelophilus]MCW7754337.1 ABC transporter permease subunit [Desulfobotulus pelophilus]